MTTVETTMGVSSRDRTCKNTKVMAFRKCFLRPPELTKIVLPKVLQNFKFHLLAREQNQKVSRITYNAGRDQRVPPFSFLRYCETFFGEKISPKGPPFNFFGFCDGLGIEKSQRVPFNFFLRCETFFKKNF